jgi:hypothetical protein
MWRTRSTRVSLTVLLVVASAPSVAQHPTLGHQLGIPDVGIDVIQVVQCEHVLIYYNITPSRTLLGDTTYIPQPDGSAFLFFIDTPNGAGYLDWTCLSRSSRNDNGDTSKAFIQS